MNINFQGIKFRFIALGIGVTLVATLLRQLVVLPQFQAQVSELVTAQHASIANYIALDIEQSISRRLALAGQFAADLPPELIGQQPALQRWIAERQRANPSFNGGMFVVGLRDNALLAESPPLPGRRQYDFARSPWLQAALLSKKPAMSMPSPVLQSGEPGILFTAPVRDASGVSIAMVVGIGFLNKPGFLDGIRESRLGASGSFMLVSVPDQLIVHASDPDMVLKPAPLAAIRKLEQAAQGSGTAGVVVAADGTEELWTLAPLRRFGWLLVARMPTEEAFKPVEGVRTFVWRATAVTMFGVLAVLIFGLTRVLKPLLDAARAMRRMADGAEELKVLPVARDDEVGNLVQGFNVLVERLKLEEAARIASDERLKYMAHHDPLTGLCNRAMLEDRMCQDLARNERHGTHMALLFCDLDGFKEINDKYGHQSGDAVLCEIATRLLRARRRSDTVARLGGDEFVILLADLKDGHKAAELVARQVLAEVRLPIHLDGRALAVEMTIGIAKHAGLAVAPSYLLSQADIAMYEAKRRGKGQFMFSDELSGPQRAQARSLQR